MKFRLFEDCPSVYHQIIEEMRAKIRRGPAGKTRFETNEAYRLRCESFYRVTRGMISLCEHQLGRKPIGLVAETSIN